MLEVVWFHVGVVKAEAASESEAALILVAGFFVLLAFFMVLA
jgi:hypothetical protein